MRAEEQFKLINYDSSDSIFDFQLQYVLGSKIKRQLYIEDSEASVYKLKSVAPTELLIIYHIPNNLEFYRREPDSIILGISKIGGLLALFKFGVILKWLHYYQCEQHMSHIINTDTNVKSVLRNLYTSKQIEIEDDLNIGKNLLI